MVLTVPLSPAPFPTLYLGTVSRQSRCTICQAFSPRILVILQETKGSLELSMQVITGYKLTSSNNIKQKMLLRLAFIDVSSTPA